jgi:hypothetical protein
VHLPVENQRRTLAAIGEDAKARGLTQNLATLLSHPRGREVRHFWADEKVVFAVGVTDASYANRRMNSVDEILWHARTSFECDG